MLRRSTGTSSSGGWWPTHVAVAAARPRTYAPIRAAAIGGSRSVSAIPTSTGSTGRASRLVRVFALGGLVVWLLRRRAATGAHAGEGVTIGFEDGTSTVLAVGSPERELLIAAAGDVA